MTGAYRIIIYNRTTDRVGGVIDIPAPLLNKVLAIAGIAATPDEVGEFALSGEQVRDISSLVNFGADFSRFHYHLEPVDPAPRRVWG